MRIGIQIPEINTYQGAVWGDEVMAMGLARTLALEPDVAFAEVYDPVTLHDNLDVVLNLYPVPVARDIQGPKRYWWYQAGVPEQILASPEWRNSLARYDGFLAASPALKDHLMGWGIPARKIALMPMSCDLEVYRRRDPSPRYAHDVVFCGNGGIRTPETVRKYLLPLRDLGLKIFGANWEAYPELQECLQGPISPSEVPLLYSSCKVVLSTHTAWHAQNNLPTSRLWEALGCNAVVVSDRVPFAERLFGDAVVWTDGFKDIEGRVLHLLRSPEGRQEIKGQGRRIIEKQLSFQAYAPNLLEIFRTGCMRDLVVLEEGEDMMLDLGEAKDSYGAVGCREYDVSADWNRQGEEAMAHGNAEEAECCFERTLQADPLCAEAHSNRGILLWDSQRRTDALHSLTRALELDPNNRKVILNCKKVFLELGKIEDTREILQAYLDRNPWDDEIRAELTNLGVIHPSATPPDFDLEPYAATLPASELANLLNGQGEAQFEQGKLDHAKACFEMALEHNPALAVAHSNLGVLCWQQGDLEHALNHLNQALEYDSEDLDIIYNSSKVLAAAGELETAANFLKLYLQRNPQDEAAWNDYGSLVKSAANSNWKPDGLDREVSQIYLKMGRALAAAKDLMGAGQAYQRAIQLYAEGSEPFLGLAELHLELEQEEDALEILRAGLQVDPAHKECLLLAGKILVSREALLEARMLYEQYLETESDEEVEAALEALDPLPAAADSDV